MLNKALTKILDGKTPYEAWIVIKLQIDHLRLFGCLRHMKKVCSNLKKLEERTKPMVLIGYEKGSK